MHVFEAMPCGKKKPSLPLLQPSLAKQEEEGEGVHSEPVDYGRATSTRFIENDIR